MPNPSLLTALARAIVAGEPTGAQIVSRCSQMLGRKWRWLTPLASRYIASFGEKVRPRQQDVIAFLRDDPGLKRAVEKHRGEISVVQWIAEPQQMQPVRAAASWNIPPISSAGALADWLRLSNSELAWFADLKGLGSNSKGQGTGSKLTHYHYRTLAKSSGSLRLIEAPKQHLKLIQRQILSEILYKIPVHPSVHGFVPGRSIKTFAAPHVGRRVVLRMDLKDFFPTFSGRRIQAFFRSAGYPESVADLLGGLCTNAAPRSVWRELGAGIEASQLKGARSLYSRPHLPQGAPTSPALANLCAYRIDCRLSGLAEAAGAVYTRYADDLAFSGEESFERCVERFAAHAAAILIDEGFSVHFRKTRIMRQSARQHLAGLVTNRRVNLSRADFDRLKALLHNCVQHGPEKQNREKHPSFRSHLEGRVSFAEMVNPQKGKRLRRLLEQIEW